MKLAISNLAWDRGDDFEIAELLRSMGINGVEIAPTKIWEKPLDATDAEIDDYRQMWAGFGIRIVAVQALLFGRQDLRIFDSPANRAETLAYLAGMTRLAGRLGAAAMVFGSPRNRLKGLLKESEATSIAVPFFRTLAAEALACGTVFCIEPNPAQYGADWILTTSEGTALVEAVDHNGFALNADTGGMTLSGENPGDAIAGCAAAICHFHISEKDLAPIGSGSVDHIRYATSLAATGYRGWKSIEMRQPPSHSREAVAAAVSTALKQYSID